MPPDLSVIIPTYNRVERLDSCLASLQTCGIDPLDIVVVDDGSTDETVARFRSDRRCSLYRQTNQGPAAARNLGLSHARGRYVAFLDSDDRWLPNVAPKLIGFLERHPEIDAVFTDALMGNDGDGYRSWIEVAGQDAFFKLPYREPEPGLRVLEPIPFFRRMACRNAVFLGSLVIRRSALDAVGRFDPELFGTEDWELWLRMASSRTFAYWPEPLAVYTRHDDNLSSNRERMGIEFSKALEKVQAKCRHLAREDRSWIRTCLREIEFGVGYMAYDRGATRQARERFVRCLRLGGGPKVLAYWLASCLPATALTRFREVKRRVVG
jgi:glycosyltransferase involved in cell wall biosynthesis